MATVRTAFAVRRAGGDRVETIVGPRHAWRFRAHYHAGDEVAHIIAGRARLRAAAGTRVVEAGDTIVVPAGTMHQFEPIDADGWAFRSEFFSNADTALIATAGKLRIKNPYLTCARDALIGRSNLRTNVDLIAAMMGLSAGYLSRLCKHETGSSLHNLHVIIALQKAKSYLRDQASIAAAAAEAGFCDQAHLTREFVRMLGMTPSTFRSAWVSVS